MIYDAKIKEQFDKVIRHSQNIENPERATSYLFEQWATNKANIINAFGGNLIKEIGKVSFTLDESAKESKIISFLNYLDRYANYDAYRFFCAQREGFLENRVVEDYRVDEEKIILAGSKLVKAFKYFIHDKDLLEQVQNKASELIQENKIEGTLCFSVHPLDYLSLSENTYKWRSCHSLDGEYRAGNLSYMVDSSTIVCYLKDDKNHKLPNFPEDVPWNSKKWRCLLYLSDKWDCIFAGRQYPFFSSSALETIHPILLHSILNFDTDMWTKWHNNLLLDNGIEDKEGEWDRYEYEQSEAFVLIANQCYRMCDLVQDVSRLHYNDLLYSGCYVPYFCYRKRWPQKDERIVFYIGGDVPCLECGDIGSIPNGDGMMCCESCYNNDEGEFQSICPSCGQNVYSEEMYWVDESAEYVCAECYHDLCFICADCEEVYWNDSHRQDKNGDWICPNCYNKEEE